jgi:hypothetical protein
MAGLAMSQRFIPGSSLPMSVSVRDDSTVSLEMSWRLSGTSEWQSLLVTKVGANVFSASIQIPSSAESIDLMMKATDAYGNYIEYTALNAAKKQVPVIFELSSDKTDIGYRNGDVSVVLSGRLTDASGNPLHDTAAVPLELMLNGKKVAMVLDENSVSGSHTHDGTIRFEWHFNPTLIFGGPDETVSIDVAFDLGTYEPLHRTITLHSIYYYNPAPQIVLVSPANGSLIPAGQLIDVDVTDDGTVQVQMRLDSQAAVQLTSPWDVNTATWTDGSHRLEITATDDQLVDSSEWFMFIVDGTDPVVNILNLASGSEVPRGWPITADVSDERLDQVTYVVDNGTPQALADPYIIDTTGWDVGDHSVVIEATDLVGHVTSDSVYFKVVDSTLVVNLVSPSDGDIVRSGVQIVFSVMTLKTYTTRWAEYGTWHQLGASTSIPTTGWIEGLHVITINSTDDFGGWDELEFSLVIDDTDPVISLGSPANGSIVSPSHSLSISVIDDNFMSVTWSYWGHTQTFSSPVVSRTLGKGPGDGYFTVSVSALDRAGNKGESTFVFAMDSSEPFLDVSGVEDGDAIRLGQVLTVDARDMFLSYVKWSVDSGQESILQIPYIINTSAFSSDWHVLRVVATDYSGKSNYSNMSIFVDSAPPTIVTAFPASVSAASGFNLSANITDDFKVTRADLYYELKEGGFGSVPMYGTGSTFVGQIASTIQTWNGMIVYIRACDSVGNWAESERVKIAVSSSSDDGTTPISGDDPNSGPGQFYFVSWLSSVEGMIIVGILIGMLVLGAAIYRRHGRPSEDSGAPEGYATSRPSRNVASSVRASSPRVEIKSVAAVASARPAYTDPKPIPATVAKKLSDVPRQVEVRAAPSLLDAIPTRPIKAVAIDEETQDVQDYGALIERELILPSLKHSVFSDEVRDLTRELARYVDMEIQAKKRPESQRSSFAH